MDAVIRKLLATLDPNDRYPDAGGSVVAALDEILPAAPPKTGTRARARSWRPCSPKPHDGGVQAIATAPDGSYVLTGGGDSVLEAVAPGDAVRNCARSPATLVRSSRSRSRWRAANGSRRCAHPDLSRVRHGRAVVGPEHGQRGQAASARDRRTTSPAVAVFARRQGHRARRRLPDKMVWLWLREASGPTTACVKGHTAAVTGVAFVASDSLLSRRASTAPAPAVGSENLAR